VDLGGCRMTGAPTPVALLVDYLRDLVAPYTEVAHARQWTPNRHEATPRTHQWRHPSLLNQLRQMAAPAIHGQLFGTIHTTPGSVPAANLDAIEAIERITFEVHAWHNRITWRIRPTLEDELRGCVGAAGALDPPTQTEVAEAVQSWWTLARFTTGWRTTDRDRDKTTPAPHTGTGSCLRCGQMGTLRIRPYARMARCAGCGARWTPDTIGLLAEHLAAERGR
jgi:hypothetical protein